MEASGRNYFYDPLYFLNSNSVEFFRFKNKDKGFMIDIPC